MGRRSFSLISFLNVSCCFVQLRDRRNSASNAKQTVESRYAALVAERDHSSRSPNSERSDSEERVAVPGAQANGIESSRIASDSLSIISALEKELSSVQNVLSEVF